MKNVKGVGFQWTKKKVMLVFLMEDWRTPFVEYLAQGNIPTDKTLARQLRKLVVRYFL